MQKAPRTTIARLLSLVRPFFFSDLKWQARGLILLLGLFALSIAGLNVLLSFVARDFMTAFSLKEKDQFLSKLGLYLLAFGLTTPFTVFYSYTEQRLALLWRLWLSREILQKYFTNYAYYKVTSYEGIDNPDQRIEEDIRFFTQTSLSLFLIFCNSVLTLVLFAGILWSISLTLIVGVVLYAFVGSLITLVIGRPLVQLNFTQLKREADYRYKLVNVRDNAESIAFYRGNRRELTRARQRLKSALANFLRIINLNRNLGFFITFYNNLKPILPIVLVSPLYLSGQIEFGVVTQSADAFVRVVEALSVLIQHFGTISAVTAVVRRLGTFTEALEDAGRADPKGEVPGRISLEEGEQLEFDSVTLYTPTTRQRILRGLSFKHGSGGLLITGASGAGKSSVLRVVGGLWSAGSGRVVRPPFERSFFIPQRPYLILGSLRNQLLYGVKKQGRLDRELVDVLELVGLGNTLERVHGLDMVNDWQSILSAGEQQQLAFARLFLSGSEYVFLDESTTAIDTETEEILYRLVLERTKFFVSIGYRSSLSRFHRAILELREDHSFRMEETAPPL